MQERQDMSEKRGRLIKRLYETSLYGVSDESRELLDDTIDALLFAEQETNLLTARVKELEETQHNLTKALKARIITVWPS